MIRPLLLLAMAGLSTGCCSMDPCTGSMHCRGLLTGATVGWNGVGARCSGTLFDRRYGLLSDCCGPNGCFPAGGCGTGCGGIGGCTTGDCGLQGGGYGSGYGCGFDCCDYGTPALTGIGYGGGAYGGAIHGGGGHCGCGIDCGCAHQGYHGGIGSVVQPITTPLLGTNVAPGPAYPSTNVLMAPALTAPQTVPGLYVSPMVPPPHSYPAPTSSSPEAAAPPVIRNTYSWRTHHRRS